VRSVELAETGGPHRVAGDRSARTTVAAAAVRARLHVAAGHVVGGARRNGQRKRESQQRTRAEIVYNDATTNA